MKGASPLAAADGWEADLTAAEPAPPADGKGKKKTANICSLFFRIWSG
jgi:hypothetical protein